MSKLELNLSIDLEGITKAVEASKTLEDNELIFAKLSQIAFDKEQINLLLETFEEVERKVKEAINDKAKALYGTNWTAIKGTGYKITRSQTGAVYELVEAAEVADEYLKVKIEPNARTIEEYIKGHSKLPAGVAYNPNRGEQIRITVKSNDIDNR